MALRLRLSGRGSTWGHGGRGGMGGAEMGLGADGQGSGAINGRQGGVSRQLEGIRVSDRRLSEAAVPAAD